MMISILSGMHLVSLERNEVRPIGSRNLSPHLIPVISQFFKAFLVEINDKSRLFIPLNNVRPHGMSGNGAEIQMICGPGQGIGLAAIPICNVAVIMKVAPVNLHNFILPFRIFYHIITKIHLCIEHSVTQDDSKTCGKISKMMVDFSTIL